MLSSFLLPYNGLLYRYNMRRKFPLRHLRWPSGPTSIKTRPHMGLFFVISDHNLIQNIIYGDGDTHDQSWATSPNYWYNMLYWYNKKELNTGMHLTILSDTLFKNYYECGVRKTTHYIAIFRITLGYLNMSTLSIFY